MESSKGQQFILVKSDAALGFLADRTIIAAQNTCKCLLGAVRVATRTAKFASQHWHIRLDQPSRGLV